MKTTITIIFCIHACATSARTQTIETHIITSFTQLLNSMLGLKRNFGVWTAAANIKRSRLNFTARYVGVGGVGELFESNAPLQYPGFLLNCYQLLLTLKGD